jgi:hypothetical protein
MANFDKPGKDKLDQQAKIWEQTERFLAEGGTVNKVEGMTLNYKRCDRCGKSFFNTLAKLYSNLAFCSDRCLNDHKASLSGVAANNKQS